MLDYNFKILNIGSRPSWNPFLHVAELKCALPFFIIGAIKLNIGIKKNWKIRSFLVMYVLKNLIPIQISILLKKN